MNYIRTLFSTLIILQFSPLNSLASTVENMENLEPVPIATYEEDLTNNGLKEVIELKGVLFSQTSNYYQKILVDITSQTSKQWKIPFSGGYEPSILFHDLNHDGINDIFYQSAVVEGSELYNQHLYTLKNTDITEIPLPKQPHIRGSFQDNFQVQIQLSPISNLNPITLNIDDQANKYTKIGIYNKQGRLLQATSIMINPTLFYEPIQIGKKNRYGLKSYQQINGVDQTDRLGIVETLWYYEKNTWIILQKKWVPS